MKKLFLSLALLLGAASLSFALSEYMENSIFIVNPNMKDFSDAGIREDIKNGRAVQASPLDLKAGDIFVDVNGNAQKVIKIEKKGKNINIETASPEISEIFVYIKIPEQSTDFAKYDDALQPSANVSEISASRSASAARSVSWAEGTMLDTIMPEGSRSYSLNINIKSWDWTEWINKFGNQIDRLEDGIKNEDITGEDAKNVQNFTNTLRQKTATNASSFNIDVAVGIKFKETTNKIDYGFDWCLPHFDRHGSWWPSNWTWNSGGGYAKLNYDGNMDFGLSFDISGYAWDYFSAPIPNLAWGSTSWGPYGGLYFDMTFSGGATVGVNLYKHIETEFKYKREFNALFITRGTPVNTAKTWGPSAQQVYATLNGEIKIGPALKIGFVALGKRLAQGSVHAGGYFEGEIGCAYTWMDMDKDNYEYFHDPAEEPIEENEIFYEENEATGKYELKYPEGFTMIGDLSLGVFVKVMLECWDGKFYTYPVDYSLPILTHHGWVDKWEVEGSNWFTGDTTSE